MKGLKDLDPIEIWLNRTSRGLNRKVSPNNHASIVRNCNPLFFFSITLDYLLNKQSKNQLNACMDVLRKTTLATLWCRKKGKGAIDPFYLVCVSFS